ncbi:MAG: hypothetical protein M1835_001235 [Candelina submexicana]|nr:MAG: hypothetical protein M1835_001235 [Candelina submexicana]
MSDYDYDFDDDELYEWEDEVLDTATLASVQLPSGSLSRKDDLAEHTMHSPVYAHVDPRWETSEYFSDWEYYSDDYYDNGRSKSPTKSQDAGQDHQRSENKRKRQVVEEERKKKWKLINRDDIPALSLGEDGQPPTNGLLLSGSIVWRRAGDEKRPPVLEVGEGEKVALLKDWRDRFRDGQDPGNGDTSGQGRLMLAQNGKGESDLSDDMPNTSAWKAQIDLDHSVPRSPNTSAKISSKKKLNPARKQKGTTPNAGRAPTAISNRDGEAGKAAIPGPTKHSKASVQKDGQGTKRKAPECEVDAPWTTSKRVTSTRSAKSGSSTGDASATKTTCTGRARRP